MPSVPRTARQRARAEITAEILQAGRRHLATDGAAGLSLRAIARELGMASSAVYRYVASRDDLLTRLIIDAYNSLGAAAEEAEAKRARDDLAGRWAAVCQTVRSWALRNPNEYALVYGSPVPGYVAPADTIGPASRVSNLLVQIMLDATDRGAANGGAANGGAANGGHADHKAADDTAASDGAVAGWQAALAPLRAALPRPVPDSVVQASLMAWVGLFGIVSFELFGQFTNVIAEGPGDRDAFFARCVTGWADQLGIGVGRDGAV